MDEEEFRRFLKDTKRTRPKPKSQIGHIQLLEEFLQKERGGRSLEEATPEDLKAFAVWEKIIATHNCAGAGAWHSQLLPLSLEGNHGENRRRTLC